jgi:hypothetical protein
MEKKPLYPIRQATSLVVGCKSIKEIELVKNLLMHDMNSYPISDQGFLLTMIGLQIIKLGAGHEDFHRFFRD